MIYRIKAECCYHCGDNVSDLFVVLASITYFEEKKI